MALTVSCFNDIKCYNLTAGKSTPQFYEEAYKKKESLRYNKEYRQRIEILQDFEFPSTSSKVRVSPDGQFICAAGDYKPEIKVFDVQELGMKFSRHMDFEVVDFLFLGEDYKKMAVLGSDRTIELHAQYGKHHTVRVPKFGRSLCYDPHSCVLYSGGSSPDVYQLDLEQGQFSAPLPTSLEYVNQVICNPQLPLLACVGGDNGVVECWDVRAPKAASTLQCCYPDDDYTNTRGALCVDWAPNGLMCAVGTNSGVTRLFDVRSHRPLTERDQRNGYPIKQVRFHQPKMGSLLCASLDEKSVKIWDANKSANLLTTIESPEKLNDINFYHDSGLFFVALDRPRVGAYFIPHLGVAPKWCSYLDSMTEELEENQNEQMFDDFQFLTRDTLEQLGAEDLIGSSFLKPYLHGFFMEVKLFSKLKAASEPFAYEEYRKKKIQEKVAEKKKMRVTPRKPKVAVNTALHQKLANDQGEEAEDGAVLSEKSKRAAAKATELLEDARFRALFSNPDFEMEEQEMEETLPKSKKRKI